jgi:hypothetical protein
VRWAAKGIWIEIFHALASAGGPPAPLLIDSSAVSNCGVARRHGRLRLHGEGDGIHDAGELRQRAVAHELDGAPAILRRFGIEEFHKMTLERRQRAVSSAPIRRL